MADGGRNEPCRCGSGKKAKRCCGVTRGPGPDELAKAFLADQRRLAARQLVGITEDDFDELFHEVVHLPEIDLALQVELPALMTPELMRAWAALDDVEDFDDALGPVVASVDTPTRRAGLARVVLDMVAAGRVEPDVAAVAVIDLSVADSAMFTSSVAEAVGVAAGAARTPAGLVLAAR
jgi:SEC-C motif